MTDRKVEVPLESILELVDYVADHGASRHVVLTYLAEWAQPVSDKEIREFAEGYLSPERAGKGYTAEDRDRSIRDLTVWRGEYSGKELDGDGSGERRS